MMNERKSYNPREIGMRHDISHVSVYKEINEGRLRSYKVGRLRRISEEAEADWIREREQELQGAT